MVNSTIIFFLDFSLQLLKLWMIFLSSSIIGAKIQIVFTLAGVWHCPFTAFLNPFKSLTEQFDFLDVPKWIWYVCNIFFFFSEHYQVKRTCTDNFDVNFFMVNHACMTEGHRHGHMCFCEEDECNAANAIYQKSLGLTLLSLLVTYLSIFHTLLQRWSNF